MKFALNPVLPRSFRSVSLARAAALLALSLAAFAGTPRALAGPQTSAFTYQGELTAAGTPVTGLYDFQFRLYDASIGGSQVGATLTNLGLSVSNGRFTTQLNFPGAFAGDERWIEIGVRTAGGGAYATLSPRQLLTSTPYGTYALNAGNAANAATAANALALNGQNGAFYLNANNLASGTVPSARFSGSYTNAVTLNNVANVFAGNGAALTALNASNISTGTLADARLSTNVALRNAANTFTASNTFSGTTPIIVNDTNLSGVAFDMNSDGGTIFDIDVVGASILTRGFNVDIDSTTTKYGVDIGLTGTGFGYGVFQSNSTPGGYGYYASMTGTGSSRGVYILNNSDAGYGGYFNNTAISGTTYGLYTENNSPNGYGLFSLHDAESGTGPAVYGETDSNSGSAFAIHGVVDEVSAGGLSSGVRGENRSTTGSGIGVWGSQAGSGWGVYGTTESGRGVYGDSNGAGIGVYGYSTGSYGGYFNTGVAGGVALYVQGTASVGVITIRGGADLAEKFEFNDQATEIKPGMVVMIDDEHTGGMELATGAYNKRVAGVISGANELGAGMILGDFEGKTNPHPVALTGRVWTYVDATEAAVQPGDLLTTSNTPGYAMPVVDHTQAHGATIGKAMGSLKQGEKGMVLVLVNLQ